jgi:outer membrane protein assembly factor BamD
MIDELRLKLEQKDYENAQLYFGTAYYTAAITAFKNLINDYPSTVLRKSPSS